MNLDFLIFAYYFYIFSHSSWMHKVLDSSVLYKLLLSYLGDTKISPQESKGSVYRSKNIGINYHILLNTSKTFEEASRYG